MSHRKWGFRIQDMLEAVTDRLRRIGPAKGGRWEVL
jgi:hypothetical protein